MNSLKYEKRSRNSDDVVNDLTRDMDKCLVERLFNCSTYIYPERIKAGENRHYMPIKYPGETVGRMIIDNKGIIVDIKIFDVGYSESYYKKGLCLYDKRVMEVIQKYIGYNIEF